MRRRPPREQTLRPMSRRSLITLALAALALVALAVAPWTIVSGTLAWAAASQLRAAYGLELTVEGRSTIAFLPVPRVKFEDVAIRSADGITLAHGGDLRAEIRLLPLLTGRIEMSEMSLRGAHLDVEIDEEGRSAWGPLLGRLQGHMAGRDETGLTVRRVAVAESTIAFADRTNGFGTYLRDVDVTVGWPSAASDLTASGSLRWRGEPVRFTLASLNPSALANGRKNRFDFEATSALGRLTVAAEAVLGEKLRVAGQSSFSSRSVRDLVYWSGVQVPLGSLLRAVQLDGEFTAEDGAVSWPAVRLTLDGDRFDGAVTARSDGGRLSVTGTLAADRLNLPQAALLPSLRMPEGFWSYELLDLRGLSGADLDLRLSAADVRLAGLRLEEAAASILVKQGRFEASLGRATLNKGRIKGRLGIAPSPAGLDLRLSGSFEQVELGALLAEIGSSRWITGTANGQFALEGIGESAAAVARRLNGRATLTVKQGEIVGIALADALKRVERRPLATALDWRGGRTGFEHAHVVLNVAQGTGDIVDGQLAATGAKASLQGRVSLAERTLAVRAHVEPAPVQAAAPAPAEGMVVEIGGPWEDLSVVPSPAPPRSPRPSQPRSGASRRR